MDGVQLSQDYRVNKRRQFTCYKSVTIVPVTYLINLERMKECGLPRSHPVLLNLGLLY